MRLKLDVVNVPAGKVIGVFIKPIISVTCMVSDVAEFGSNVNDLNTLYKSSEENWISPL